MGIQLYSVMLMTIYLDTLVIVNTYMSWLMLMITARLSHTCASSVRLAIGAAIGGLASLLILANPSGAVKSVAVVFAKITAIALAAGVTFFRKHMSKEKAAAVLTIFSAVNIIFGGAVYLMQSLLKTRVIYFNKGSFYFDIPLAELIVLTAVIYLIIVVASHLTSKACDINHSYKVNITIEGKSFSLDGVADTGNTVTELISGKPVVICTGIEYSPPDGKGIYAIPYSTVDSEGLLYAFMPDSISIESEAGNIKNTSALVAFMKKGTKRAVFNPKILC